MNIPPLGLGGLGFDTFDFPFLDLDPFEDREIILADGAQFHAEDVRHDFAEAGLPETIAVFDYLAEQLGSDFNRISDNEAEYTSQVQKVHFRIRIVHSKTAFKQALDTPGAHVIYHGHSRFGRGACFDTYTGTLPDPSGGNQWEDGTGSSNGMFRLGYPFVPIAIFDLESPVTPDDGNNHHRHGPYAFRPLATDNPTPPMADRHPDARRGLRRIQISAEMDQNVRDGFKSPTREYWGLNIGSEPHLLLHAHWTGSHAAPFDLGASSLACRVFCHFGCSSRLHFREIVRGTAFKGWVRPQPPTDRYAYFTTAPSDARLPPRWLHNLLTYNRQNNFQRWFESLEDAKRRTNLQLTRIGERFQVF